MKNKTTIFTIALLAIISSCTKGPSSTTPFACKCSYKWSGKDTSITYPYPGLSRDSAQSKCNVKDKGVKSMVGSAGGGCTLTTL